jgi:hypothetical protein
MQPSQLWGIAVLVASVIAGCSRGSELVHQDYASASEAQFAQVPPCASAVATLASAVGGCASQPVVVRPAPSVRDLVEITDKALAVEDVVANRSASDRATAARAVRLRTDGTAAAAWSAAMSSTAAKRTGVRSDRVKAGVSSMIDAARAARHR